MKLIEKYRQNKKVKHASLSLDELVKEQYGELQEINFFALGNGYSIIKDYYLAQIELARDVLEIADPNSIDAIRAQERIKLCRDFIEYIEDGKNAYASYGNPSQAIAEE